MAKAPKHAATIRLEQVADDVYVGKMRTKLRVIKIIDGRADYVMETFYAANAYECAMDMARGTSKNVRIKHDVARFMKEQAFDVSGEWTIVADPFYF